MNYCYRLFLILFLLALPLACSGVKAARTPGAIFYVSPAGKDSWSGLRADPDSTGADGPFASLERARSAVRELRRLKRFPKDGVAIYLREGVYERSESFRLTAEDSGSPDAPVIWRPYPGERARILGGKRIRGFYRVADPAILKRLDIINRDKIVYASLWRLGIRDFGTMRPRGFGRVIEPAALELFFNGKPMNLSRWPNDDWVRITGVPGKQPDPMDLRRTDKPSSGIFQYEGDRPRRWADTSDIWMHGYWTWDWADSYERIRKLDTAAHTIETWEPHGVYGYKEKQRYYYLNILEELDEPGEWYLDRRSNNLYFWPPEPPEKGETCVSLLEKPLIVLENASHIVIRGFTLEVTRGHGVEITGGTGNLVAGCTLRNIGNVGAVIRGGTKNGILSCDIYDTGDGGIILEGGDRKTLAQAGNFAVNNHIHDYSRWVRTYRPAILLSGVGNRVANNHIHDAPHMGVGFSGNDHVLECNEVHDICRETGDVGAFYIGRDWTMRGNIVRHNFFHHIKGPGNGGAMAVYLDDAASGTLIYGNIFYRASRAAFIGGGRDNTVENNIFVECEPSVHVDGRGIGWADTRIAPGGAWGMYEKLEAVNWRKSPYSRRYPQLVTITEDSPALPKRNVVVRNISVGGRWLNLADGIDSLNIVTLRDNFTEGAPGFINPKQMDFRLRQDSPVWKIGFKPIPFEKIGLFRDEYRISVIKK
ncbi:MAG: right-handed parallel beta-helix repeat-containing protein [Candidatus Latescibacterota bacterium]